MAPNITSAQTTSHGRATNELKPLDFFPPVVTNEKDSCATMKKLTAITISTVLYHRNMFPESDYGQRTHRDQIFYILDKKAETPQAREVVSMVQSLFKPIDQKYLKSIVIGFCEDPNNPSNVVEAYLMNYQYSANEIEVNHEKAGKRRKSSSVLLGDDDIGESAAKTFAKLMEICKAQDSLEKRTVYMTMQLRYTDETPEDYEPEGFSPGTTTSFTCDGGIKSFKCGAINTPFHGFKLKANMSRD